MTKDETLKLALEALENIEDYGNKEQLDQNHVAITALRQALEQPSDIEAAVRAENEACAKVCENLEIPKTIYGAHPDYLTGKYMAVSQCAAAIRERMK